MAYNGNDNLKVKTVSGIGNEEEFTFSPEEMQPTEVAEALESDLVTGKTVKQIKKARKLFGVNEIRRDFRISFVDSLKNQIKSMTGLFLMLSSLVMYLYRREEATFLVLTILTALIMLINAYAEHRASLALQVPKKYSSLKAKVIRNGEETLIDSRLLVPGDIVLIETGTIVPADCRLIDDTALSVLESHVSGEQASVAKDSRYVARNGSEVICANMVYAGSIVTSGNASAIVCRTGRDTLLRRMRVNSDDRTPNVIKYVKRFCGFLSVASVISALCLMFFGILAGADITAWFICALAIGESSLCNSMVSLCISSLGFGAKKMADDGMVIKNYDCIQTLAKTNTIMCGKNLAFPPKRISLTGLYLSGKDYDREKRPVESVKELLKLMLVCSDARRITAAERKQKRGLPEYKGSPIDDAIVEYFGEWNEPIGMIREQYIRMDAEYTLSGDISRLLALHNGKNTIIVRGSPENILSRCAGYTLDGTDYKLSDFTRKKILSAVEDSARTSSILIAVACGETQAEYLRDIEAEQRLIFKGFISFASSLDPGIASSVYRCESAGIETVLNSNDAYYTALHSAKSAGIIHDETQIITSEQLRSCSRGLLIANAPYYRLFLNVDDSEWMDIVKLRKENKRVTAVTAERINELPIMSESDVSIVPESACDTLKQTADAMMLGTGINLIADGILSAKTIMRRIGAVVKYLPAGILIMLVASMFSAFYNQTPALRAQDIMFGGIIFNLMFAFGLAFEPRSVKNLREKFPLHGKKPMLNDFMYPLMFSVGGGIVLFFCSAATQSYTCSMITLSMMLFLYACSIAGHGGFFATRRFGNRLLYLCGFAAFAVIALLVLTPFGRSVFGYSVPEMSKLMLATVLGAAYCIVAQIIRFFMIQNGKAPNRKANTKHNENKAAEETVEAESADDGENEEADGIDEE